MIFQLYRLTLKKLLKEMFDNCHFKGVFNNLSRMFISEYFWGRIYVGSKKIIPSYEGTLRMATLVDRRKKHCALNDVINTTEIILNRFIIAQSHKKHFRARIDDSTDKLSVGRIEIYHNPSREAKACGCRHLMDVSRLLHRHV